MRVEANGIGFNCRVDGPEGAPWIVFSNSLTCNLGMWDDQVAGLQDSFRILRYDQRGHGATDAPPGPYTFDLLAQDVIALMDALSISRAHFCGLSMGGTTALLLAQRHGARFDRIIPCDCGLASPPEAAQQWQERVDLAAAQGMAALVEPTLQRWFPAEFRATGGAVLAKFAEAIRTTPFDGYAGCAQALSDFDVRAGLAAITNPVLAICGTADAAYPAVQRIAETVPGATLVDIEGAGHISNAEQPETFTKAIRDFLTA